MTISSEQLLAALENERYYVARELHDGVAQTTLQLNLQIGICRKLLEHGQQERLTGELAELEQRIHQAADQMRRMIADMRPPKVSAEAGLDEYLQHLIDIHLERGGPAVTYHPSVDHSLELLPNQIVALTRAVQECLLNIRKHAEAQQVCFQISEDETYFQFKITDDGQGFDLAELKTRTTDKGGAGLANLYARVEAIGGTLTIVSHTGQGTEVTITLPK